MSTAAAQIATTVDRETHASQDDHLSLRLWLRLLTCTTLIEQRVRAGLREEFATTLPRFDLMAQLQRNPDGLLMNELSRRMMVTGGNITTITDQLEHEGLVERLAIPDDRRAWRIRLTVRGARAFEAMARAHESWIIDMLAGLTHNDQMQLHQLLGRLKNGVRE